MAIQIYLQESGESCHTYHSSAKINSALSTKGIPEFSQSNILFEQYSDKQHLSNLIWPSAFALVLIYTKLKQTNKRNKQQNPHKTSKKTSPPIRALPPDSYTKRNWSASRKSTLYDKIIKKYKIFFSCIALMPLNVTILWHIYLLLYLCQLLCRIFP